MADAISQPRPDPSHVVIFGPSMRQVVSVHLSHKTALLLVLSILGAQMALPATVLASPVQVTAQIQTQITVALDNNPTGDHQAAAESTQDATTAIVPVTALKQHRAGYPTTREKWRYCPRDGSHPCVDLDIPGVTEPETPNGQ